jgi:bifunctional DNA-binding transcriptional regulator/antitoxin component of YhaV-PrlF toxin-antitoxin module
MKTENGKSETWNLTITAPIDERNRIVVPKTIAEHATLKDGDIVTFVITQIHRKEA